VHTPVALFALAVVTVVAPGVSPGCAAPVVDMLRLTDPLPAFASPAEDDAQLADDRRAVTAATAAVADRKARVAEADALEVAAGTAREKAADAAADAFDAELSGGWLSGSSVRSAEYGLESAKTAVESAESWVTTVEGWAADNTYMSSDYYDDMVADAKTDLQEARQAQDDAEAALEEARADEAAENAAVESARATADALQAEAEAAGQNADAAAQTARAELEAAEDELEAALNSQRLHELEYEGAVAEAYAEYLENSAAIRASNASLTDCQRNGVPHFAAAGILALSGAGIGMRGALAARSPRRRRGKPSAPPAYAGP
jgi:chromosome segregation ATPase